MAESEKKNLLFYILTIGNDPAWPAIEVTGFGQDDQCQISGELWEFSTHYHHVWSRGSSVSIVTRLQAERPPRLQTGSGAHSASYPIGTRGSFPGGKAAGVWGWPLIYI